MVADQIKGKNNTDEILKRAAEALERARSDSRSKLENPSPPTESTLDKLFHTHNSKETKLEQATEDSKETKLDSASENEIEARSESDKPKRSALEQLTNEPLVHSSADEMPEVTPLVQEDHTDDEVPEVASPIKEDGIVDEVPEVTPLVQEDTAIDEVPEPNPSAKESEENVEKSALDMERERLEEAHARDQKRLQEAHLYATETIPEIPVVKEVVTEEENEQTSKKKKSLRFRLIPIWLRLIIIMALVTVAGLTGIYVGFVILGAGDSDEVFKIDTWRHILDLVNKT